MLSVERIANSIISAIPSTARVQAIEKVVKEASNSLSDHGTQGKVTKQMIRDSIKQYKELNSTEKRQVELQLGNIFL